MDENLRYYKDRSTVMAIIKYVLFIAIAGVILYYSSKLIVIIVPFLIGFVLAKASRQIAKGIIRIENRIYLSRHKNHPIPKEDYVPTVENADDAEEAEYPEFFSPNRLSDDASSIKSANETDTKPAVPQAKKQSWILSILFPPKNKDKISHRTKISLVVYIALLVVTLAAFILAGMALVVQLNKVISIFSEWITHADIVALFTQWVSQFSTQKGGFLAPDQIDGIIAYVSNLKKPITDMLPNLVNNVFGVLLSILKSLPMLLFSIIVVIMSGFYFLSDSKMVLRFFSRNIKSRFFRHKSIQLVDRLATTLFRVLGGYLLLLIVTFFESIAIFLVAGVNYAVILALVTAVLDFMPVLGVSATMVPMIIYQIVQGNYTSALILVIGMLIITIVRRFLEPPVLGNAMHMHPLATLFAMIVGVALWGAIGFLMGPVVFLVLGEAFKGFNLDKKFREVAGNILNKFAD